MKKHLLYVIFSTLFLAISLGHAQISRPYEPIIITGDSLSQFLNKEIDNLFLYRYDANENSWRLIPFQVDEVNPAVKDSVKYFIPEDSLHGLLDTDDELVFMAADLGDLASDTSWISETDTTRIELSFFDPLDNSIGYVYLYYSTVLNEPVPNTFGLGYDIQNDRVFSNNYEVGFNYTGQLSDVLIDPSIGGSGNDIFDRIKIRAIGSWLFVPIFLYEEYISSSYAYVKTGPVRIIRNMAGSFNFDPLNVDEKFTQTSFFYPWHGAFSLIDLPLGQAKDVGVQIDRLRVSWDFSQDAQGMKFFSENNRAGFTIDGSSDAINNACFPDELNWTMGSGDAGTILNCFYIPSLGENINLYYHEATDSSTADDMPGLEFDTGDFMSYADNGYILKNNIQNYITKETTFNFLYYNFFLPSNFDPNHASLICEQLKTPLSFETTVQKHTPAPTYVQNTNSFKAGSFSLLQNYPNPFNSSTTILFVLAEKSFVNLKIYDSLGRLIKTITEENLTKGTHLFKWNGKNDNDVSVPTGMYFYRVVADEFSAMRKLILIK
ncbi:T9SS type A sorting domain-containing protein [candidate division KSB1 bacterium]|nr:T9SS type A sorting domain-containing protein [candidate division KSB1 bacterium]